MPFYVFAWIASLSYGLTGIITKLTSKYSICNPWFLNFLFISLQLVVTIPLALNNQVRIPLYWDNLIFASLTYAFFGIFYIFSLSKLDISVYVPLFNFRAVFGVLLGIIFLGEKIAPFQTIFVVLLFISGIFASMDEKLKLSSFFKPQIGIALVSVLLLAANGLFINKAITQNNYWSVTLWQYILAMIFLIPTIPKFHKEIRKINWRQLLAILSIAFSLLIGDLAANRAFAENLGISSLIISLPFSMIIAFALSFFAPMLLEKHTLKIYAIRFTAAAMMIISALKLSSS